MKDNLTRTSIGDGVNFSFIINPKFKQNIISFNFITRLDEDGASDNAVVPFILRRGSKKFPDFTALNGVLASLYGAGIDASVSKHNAYQVITLSVYALDNRFALENENITNECAQLLSSLIFEPKTENEVFPEQETRTEKQYIIDSIEADINEKRMYSLAKCKEIMCCGEAVAVKKFGSLKTAGEITAQSAYNAYKKLLEEAVIEIIFIGSGDPGDAKTHFEGIFKDKKRNAEKIDFEVLKPAADKVKEETENMDISQSKLVMGFRTGRYSTPEEVFAMRLCVGVLGGTPFSKLFLNVRERLSLCYYCAARFDQPTKLLFIDSGIEKANKETAQKEIMAQIEKMANGEITSEEITNTKLLVKNNLLSVNDSLSSLEDWYISQIIQGTNITPEEDAGYMDKVTKEDIVKAAKNITLDTVFFLTSEEQ